MHDSDHIKLLAYGRWDLVFRALLPEIAEAIDHPGRHIRCPYHGGDRDFRAHRDYQARGTCICSCTQGYKDGFGMLMFARHWTFPEALERVKDVMGGGYVVPVNIPAPVRVEEDHAERDRKNIDRMNKAWGEARSLTHQSSALARRYFIARGIGNVIEHVRDVRFHPYLPYFNDATKQYEAHPALLAVIRSPDGRVVGLHRTWLCLDGNSVRVYDRKQTASLHGRSVVGAAIRLTDSMGECIALAEGIETALSVRVMDPTMPVWSTLNKQLLMSVELPESIRVVSIFADADVSFAGQEAAMALLERLREQGRLCTIVLPPEDERGVSVDWNDTVRAARNPVDLPEVQHWQEQLQLARRRLCLRAA